MTKLLTARQAAKSLGLTVRATQLKIQRRELPFKKMGHLVRIPEDALEQYLAALAGCDVQEAVAKIQKGA